MNKRIIFFAGLMLLPGNLDQGENATAQADVYATAVSRGAKVVAVGQGGRAVAGGVIIDGNVVTGGTATQDTGEQKTEQRSLTSYNAVEIHGVPGEFLLQVGEKHTAVVTADSAVVPLIDTVVNSGTLKVRLSGSLATNAPVQVRLGVEELSSVSVNGVADVVIEGLHSKKLQLSAKGTASIMANGTVDELQAVVVDSGELMLKGLVAKKCTVTANGVENAVIHTVDALSARAGGASNIIYYGKPTQVSREVSGAGEIEARDK